MSNLLPCPFCGGEAELHDGVVIIPVIDENGAYIDADVEDTPAWVECAACGAATDGVDSADEAIERWNRRAQPENEPLTLDELRKMDGEPVWTVTNGVEGSGRWEILESVDNEFMRLCNPVDTTYDCPIDTYGKTWLAYRTKPERSEG